MHTFQNQTEKSETGPVNYPTDQISTDLYQNSSAGVSIKSKEDKSLGEESEIIAEEPPQVAPNPHGDIPNGGVVAWLQVLGSFFLFFNSWYVQTLEGLRNEMNRLLIMRIGVL